MRRRLIAHGHVQGVFFRDTVRREATARGVAGSAANLPDGTVECVLEGEPDDIEALVELCRTGPGRATVERLECFDEPPEGLTGFVVR